MNSLIRIHRLPAIVTNRLTQCRRLLSISTEEDIPPDFRPHRIILLRHGESQGNVDQNAYVTTAGEILLYNTCIFVANKYIDIQFVELQIGGYRSPMLVGDRLEVSSITNGFLYRQMMVLILMFDKMLAKSSAI
jgi:hypothetical protein